MSVVKKEIQSHLAFLYGDEKAPEITNSIVQIIEDFKSKHSSLSKHRPQHNLSERDVILITYADMVRKPEEAPLKTLASFTQEYLAEVISAIHILPFYPYSSDDGFSVINYKEVDPALGTWDDVTALGQNFKLMFDAVVNHISIKSPEFQGFLNNDPRYEDYFIVVSPGADTSRVFRPRSQPLLTPFQTTQGEELVWTTFSADQIDWNYSNPNVLLEIINILLFYLSHNAEFIRLDAVTFLWKDLNTNCINLPETHRIIQLLRTIMDYVAPSIVLITETNVPHKDNIAYFGDGHNEAQMVYNFALPMLVLHSFHTGNVDRLSNWARTLELPSKQVAFFNFLAGHDGIGITPVKNILSQIEIDRIIDRTRKLGGFIACKDNGDGTQSPYELNINYLNALDDPEDPTTDPVVIAKRFIAAHAIMLALRGVPGIYFHSMFGSENWIDGVKETGRYRTINREKLLLDNLTRELLDDRSLRYHVYQKLHRLLDIRRSNPGFHPYGDQKILSVHPAVFSLIRSSSDGKEHILCLHNTTDECYELSIDLDLIPFDQGEFLVDIINNQRYQIRQNQLQISILPYEVYWLGK